MVTMIIVVIIDIGCNLQATPEAVLLWGAATVSCVAGAATFTILTILALINWLKRKKGVVTPSEDE